MTLLEALRIVNENHRRDRAGSAHRFKLGLFCGFLPLHFKTFLAAQIVLRRPAETVEIADGLFGDLPGSLERLRPGTLDAVVVVIEWGDLDTRLGLRSTGGWHPGILSEVVRTSRLQLERIGRALKQLGPIPRFVAGPTLPLQPVFHTRPSQLSSLEADLRSVLTGFSQELIGDNVIVIGPQAVDIVSDFKNRLDVKSELSVGFPYTMLHAEALARVIALEINPPARKKGLITDLDNTLWRGILGEAGVEGICWTLEKNAHCHALYQQFLSSLADAGILLAVASKNSPEIVTEALNRPDLLLSKDHVFPVEAHWGAKSQSVARILSAWNIGADAVVFVDDSTMELAEVQAAFPEIECLAFPQENAAEFWNFLVELRNRFGTRELTTEDTLRAESLRSRAEFEAVHESAADADAFLSEAQAEITFTMVKSSDPRPLELINKTNQFNLNGTRLTEAEWTEILADPNQFVVKATYTDRYGPLGAISVAAGEIAPDGIVVNHWVMSCRAFSRRIEHQFLQHLFERSQASNIILNLKPTLRNGPIREFLATFVGSEPSADVNLSRRAFDERCPALYHTVREDLA